MTGQEMIMIITIGATIIIVDAEILMNTIRRTQDTRVAIPMITEARVTAIMIITILREMSAVKDIMTMIAIQIIVGIQIMSVITVIMRAIRITEGHRVMPTKMFGLTGTGKVTGLMIITTDKAGAKPTPTRQYQNIRLNEKSRLVTHDETGFFLIRRTIPKN
jgi:hypothetical protein